MRGRAVLLLIGIVAFSGACGGEDAGQAQRDASGDTAVAAQPDPGTSHDAHAPAGDVADDSAAHAHAGTSEPRDLLPIMQKLGSDMAALTHGIMTEDTALVARSAEAIAHHAPIAPSDIDRIHAELGDAMAEFERLDEEVHEASVRLHEAVEGGAVDMEAVLSRLNEVQRGCVACHTLFRDRLRTNPRQ